MYTGVLNAFQRVDYLLRAFAVALREKPDALLLVVSPLVSESHEKEYGNSQTNWESRGSIIWISPHTLAGFAELPGTGRRDGGAAPRMPWSPGQIVELHAGGKPVVSFAGGAKGVRHLHDAFIVPNHDFEALGRGIVTLLNDRTLAAELGANARRHGSGGVRLASDLPENRANLRSLLGGSIVPCAGLNEPVASAAVER